jgi:hypothetical protein
MIEQIANAPIEEESPGRRLTHLWLISRDMATTSNSAQDSPVLRFDTLLQRVACDFALHLRFASDLCISQFANASKTREHYYCFVLSCFDFCLPKLLPYSRRLLVLLQLDQSLARHESLL